MRLPTFAENNRAFSFLFSAVPAAGGSAVSILLGLSFVWQIFSLAIRRYPFRTVPTDWIVILPATFYVLVATLSILLHGFRPEDVRHIAQLLTFLYFWGAIPRYRNAPLAEGLPPFLFGASLCGVIAFPVILYQWLIVGTRVEGAAGNPFPFAMACMIFGPIALANLLRPERYRQVLALAGFLSCGLGALLSGTRTAWLAFAVNTLIMGVFLFRLNRLRLGRKTMIATALLAVVAIVPSAPLIEARVSTLVSDVDRYLEGKRTGESLTVRLELWDTAVEAIPERPIFGYGHQNRLFVMNRVPPEQFDEAREAFERGEISDYTFFYSHFHNGFLSAAVDSGLVGLFAVMLLLFSPLALALCSPSDGWRALRIAIAAVLVSSYTIVGSLNLMFGHDIIDAIFVITCVMLAISVPAPWPGGFAKPPASLRPDRASGAAP